MPEIELSDSTIALNKSLYIGEKGTIGEIVDSLIANMLVFLKDYQYATSESEHLCHIFHKGTNALLCRDLSSYTLYFGLDAPDLEEYPICDECRDIYWGIPEHISKN